MTELTIAAPTATVPAYLARPSGVGPWAGVVVVHDALGLSQDIRHQADWLAGAGYLAIAPDLFARSGRMAGTLAVIRSVRAGRGRTFDEVEAARAALANDPACTGRVGVIGFCMGGGIALALAPDHGFEAASANYGMLPAHPETALRTACPIVGSYGARDRTLRGAAAKLERILTALGIDHDIREYPGAGHAFLNDHSEEKQGRVLAVMSRLMGGMGYHEASAVDARRRILAFFDRHLKMGAG
ncbi:MAG: dienelactone hydrolase family protein [Candidatus Dormibacteria bacterium]